MPEEVLLNSWKQIARYVGRSERTVQRWERRCGLPVRRPAGKMRSAVIAIPSEIRAWTESSFKNGVTEACRPVDDMPVVHAFMPPPKRSPTILCIDDHPASLAVRKATLETLGYRVLSASTFHLGMRAFEHNDVDLVVMDYWVSSLGGDSLVPLLQKLNPRVPVLLLSGANRNVPDTLLKMVSTLIQKTPLAEHFVPAIPVPAGEAVAKPPSTPTSQGALERLPYPRAA